MTGDRGANPDSRYPVDRDAIDRLIDRELSADERRALIKRLRHDTDALDEVVEMRRLAGRFRQNIDTPDLTTRVLHGVDRRRGFLSARLRRRVKQGRAAVTAAALLAMFALAVAHRLNPDAFRFRDVPTPVADLGDAVVHDSIDSRRVLADAVRGLEPVDLVDPHADHGSPAGMAEFHVPVGSASSVPEDAPERYVVLNACADAEVLALGGPRTVFASIEVASAWAHDRAYPVSTVDWSVPPDAVTVAGVSVRLHGLISSDADLGVERGVVPMSPLPARGSAYVGRFDPFRDGPLRNTQPDARSRVLDRDDDR